MEKIKTFYHIESLHPEIWKKHFFHCQLWKVSRDGIYKKFIREESSNYSIAKAYKKNIKNIFFNLSKVDCLVIENPRKINLKNSYIDPYTENIVRELFSKNKKILLINNGHNGLYQLNSNYISYTSNCGLLDSILRKGINAILKTSKVCREYISLVNKIFRERYDQDLNFYISNYFLDFLKFSIIFKFTKPKELYLVCSYGKEGLIQAAKNNNIKVIEMQHGIVGNFHPGYSFGKIQPDHFPDEIMLFGQYWKDSTNFPISKLSFYKKYELPNIPSEEIISDSSINIIVISQKSAREKLVATTKSLARHNPSFEFIFKLHPKEFHEIDLIEKEFIGYKNIQISRTNNLVNVLQKSTFVICIDSTSIFEALAEYKPVFLLPDSSNNFFSNLIEKKYIKILHNMNVDLKNLDQFNQDYEKDYFFMKN